MNVWYTKKTWERRAKWWKGEWYCSSGSLVSYSILPAAPSFMHVTTLASYVVPNIVYARDRTHAILISSNIWKVHFWFKPWVVGLFVRKIAKVRVDNKYKTYRWRWNPIKPYGRRLRQQQQHWLDFASRAANCLNGLLKLPRWMEAPPSERVPCSNPTMMINII